MSSVVAGITSLPPEVLEGITSLLSASHIVLLYMSGCRVLMNRLTSQGGVQRLSIDLSSMQLPLFPQIVGQFVTLQSLRVYRGLASCYCLMEPIECDLALLPSTLRVLDISPLYFTSVESRSFHDKFPVLEALFGHIGSDYLSREPIRGPLLLPPTLTSLDILYFPSSGELRSLPQTLRSLKVVFEPSSWTEAQSLACGRDLFPPNLESLTLYSVPLFVLKNNLPSKLTTLTINSTSSFGSEEDEAIRDLIPKLSQGILSLTAPLSTFTASIILGLPQNLTHLKSSCSDTLTWNDDLWHHLPRSLERFEINPMSKIFRPSEDPGAIPEAMKIIESLPPRLLKLPRSMLYVLASVSGIEALPKSLTEIRCYHFKPGYLTVLPPTITSLACSDDFTCGDDETLPSTLTKLGIGCWKDSTVRVLQRSNLPRLTALNASLSILAYQILSSLPPSLQHLNINWLSYSTRDMTPEPFDWSAKFPNLTSMTLRDPPNEVFVQVISTMPRKLESLVSSSIRSDVNPDSLRLLREESSGSLIELWVSVNSTLKPEHIVKLPRKLHKLIIKGTDCTLKESDFEDFTRLHFLSIPSTLITKDAADRLPKSIITFYSGYLRIVGSDKGYRRDRSPHAWSEWSAGSGYPC